MSITCLTITQPSRLPMLRQVVADFSRQSHASRSLLIVHDGDRDFEHAVQQLVRDYPGEQIRSHRAAPGQSLGALRNLSLTLAESEFICQWDDDDRHHPQRLRLQLEALQREAADFCFLSEQLHWFPASAQMYWTDWNLEPYPLNFIQGTLLGRRERMPRYADLARGEDTALCLEMLRADHRLARLRGCGWLYVYVFHGGNAWSAAHHRAIVAQKRLPAARLLGPARTLEARLREYQPGFGRVVLPSEAGELVFDGL